MIEHSSQGKETPKQGVFIIDGLPNLVQKHKLWCGWTSASELAQYHGYKQVTQEKLFSYIHGKYDWSKENYLPTSSPKPTIDTMAEAIAGLTELIPRIASKKDFDDIRERNPAFATPHDVLQYYIKKKLPCIIRTPGHFMVTKGMDLNEKKYMFNDPRSDKIKTLTFNEFDRDWKQHEREYNRDTSYLMLTISTRKKTPQA